MSVRRALAISLAACGTGMPALAASDADERASKRFAKCAVERQETFVSRGLLENWAPEKFMVDMKRSARDKCLRGIAALPMSSPDLRYALARAWLDRRNLLAVPLNFSSAPPLRHDFVDAGMVLRRTVPGQRPEDARAAEISMEGQTKVFSQVGECVVRADAEKVRLFLASDKGAASADLVTPLLPRCVPVNFQYKVSPAELSGLLAFSYARLAIGAQPRSTGIPADQQLKANYNA